jgi:hypothetical protein
MMKNTLRLGLIVLVSSFAACSSTSRTFVDGISGYSVVRGRITEIDNLSAENKAVFSDGLAVTVTKPGCKVSITFPDKQTKVVDVEPGMILVHGYAEDFLLRSEFTTPTPPVK